MELRHLRYFVAVAEELHFTRAAQRLRIAQPPLSQQIRNLERELGLKLLNRTRRRVELTPAGRVFLEHARWILQATESAAVLAQRAERGEIGRLAVGFFEYMSYTLLPPILRAYRERFPGVDVQVRWFPNTGQADALRQGLADLCLARPLGDERELLTESLLTEPFILAIPSSHKLAAKKVISIAQCATEPLILYSRPIVPDFHAKVLAMCATAGFSPRIALEVGQVYTALGLVDSAVGIALVPASVQRIHLENVVYRPLREREPDVEVVVAWHKRNSSPLLEAFTETAKRVVAESKANRPPVGR